jgi:hypothetical protein
MKWSMACRSIALGVGDSADFLHWVANMNDSLGQHGGKLLLEEEPFDLIHAHDWLVSDAAIALKHTFKIPLVADNSCY